MNLNRFIDCYGNYSFDEVPFTEVDNVILANLSYVNLGGLIPGNGFSFRRLQDVANRFFEGYSKKEKNIYAVRKAIKLFENIKDTKRYKDLHLYYYIYEFGSEEQFSAFTIEINPHLVYVSFEGTDQLVSGWKEDFMFGYCFPTISQKRAIDYINRHFWFRGKKIILGGHSKGGNLAIVAGMYANSFVKSKIITIYNNDGPGLLKEQLESRQYQSIKDRLVNIVPNYSMVGIILNNNDYVVVRSMKKGIFSHDVMSWVVDDKCFERSELSNYSKNLHEKLLSWIDKYDKDTIERFVKSLFSVFDRASIKSIIDIFENKKLILKFILETKDIDKESKKMIREFLLMLFQLSSDVKLEEIKMMFQRKAKE